MSAELQISWIWSQMASKSNLIKLDIIYHAYQSFHTQKQNFKHQPLKQAFNQSKTFLTYQT